MTKEQIFSVWAPPSSLWSAWVKPVLFSHMHDATEVAPLPAVDVTWANRADGSTAIVVDLPGNEGVAAGLSLIELGYRPIPLYNAAPEPASESALVEVRPIMLAMAQSASVLLNIRLADDAPPAFLLDSNRRTSRVAALPGVLDNRSISLPTDFPSGTLLVSHGIQRVLLIQRESTVPQADLSHTLRRWQELRVNIIAKDLANAESPQPVTVERPRAFKVLWHNLLATMGLRASPLGGFGGRLPMPSSG